MVEYDIAEKYLSKYFRANKDSRCQLNIEIQ